MSKDDKVVYVKNWESKAHLTATEAAAVLRCGYSTLARWRALGDGPPWIKIRGKVLYSVPQLMAWIHGEHARSTSDGLEP
jgi:hypothetical protein